MMLSRDERDSSDTDRRSRKRPPGSAAPGLGTARERLRAPESVWGAGSPTRFRAAVRAGCVRWWLVSGLRAGLGVDWALGAWGTRDWPCANAA